MSFAFARREGCGETGGYASVAERWRGIAAHGRLMKSICGIPSHVSRQTADFEVGRPPWGAGTAGRDDLGDDGFAVARVYGRGGWQRPCV
jgi:hypothetical protein